MFGGGQSVQIRCSCYGAARHWRAEFEGYRPATRAGAAPTDTVSGPVGQGGKGPGGTRWGSRRRKQEGWSRALDS